MQLYLIAPFHSCFSLKASNYLEDEGYRAFWNAITAPLKKSFPDLALLHTTKSGCLRYEVIEQDSQLLKEEAVKFFECESLKNTIDEALAAADTACLHEQLHGKIRYLTDSATITLLDNTIGMFEIQFEFEDDIAQEHPMFARNLQHWTNSVVRQILSHAYPSMVQPFIDKVISLDKKSLYIEKPGKHYGFPSVYPGESTKRFSRKTAIGEPLWVNRTIIQGPGSEIPACFFNEWIFTNDDKSEVIRLLRQGNNDEKKGVYLAWGNNYIYAGHDQQVVKDAKRILLLTQYFYVMFDSMSLNLSHVIGSARNIRRYSDSTVYNEILKELVDTVSLIEIKYIDTLQNIQGNREVFFRDLTEKWAFHEIMQNIDKKAQVCKNKIHEQYQKSFKKSQMMAELLLLFLGGISLLEFTNSIVTYWLTGGVDDGVFGLYNLGKVFPPNALLWGALFLLSLFFFVYIKLYLSRKE